MTRNLAHSEKLTTKLPPELVMLVLKYAFDLRVGKTSVSYWLYLGHV